MLNLNLFLFYPLTLLLLSITFPLLNNFMHPLNLMINLIIYSISVSLLINYNNNNLIYPYILFLIMIGGMLVMFLYFSSLINNEKSKTSFISLLIYFFILLSFILILLIKLKFLYLLFIKINNLIYLNKFTSIYNNYLKNTTILLIYFLFYSMIMVISLCKNNSLSLRKFIYV
nr:NADH dehydrogenase subunit 6 [Diodontus sp. a EB-2023]WRY74218.1 NADH dehydrogenase subunit 6 [Diodontus sp. a EB-2023]WRY74221.1 NADH dehydrogenase subunit 6 [Diodontus sp. a EB-2023]WRY74223.1 NADH dehydrogenase subunit 6 [Diodontus sp. a EB-2023]WRY74225.1 NADH dehydrogenase subunit 6 [Diodontus sp. a EB-2023]